MLLRGVMMMFEKWLEQRNFPLGNGLPWVAVALLFE